MVIDIYPTISSFILNQISGLLDLGHQVYVFPKFKGPEYLPQYHDDRLIGAVLYPSKYPIKRMRKYVEALKIIIQNILRQPVPVIYALNPFKFGRKALNLSVLFDIAPFLISKWDIAQVHYGDYADRALLLKNCGWKVKVVTMFHGYDIRKGITEGGEIYNDLKTHGDCVLSICSYNYTHLVQFGFDSRKIIYHPVGIDTYYFNYFIRKYEPGQKLIILSVGRLVWEKGYPYALDGMKLIKQKKVNFEYRIIGEGPALQDLMRKCAELGLNEHVTFLGLKNQEDIKHEMHNSHLFLLSSVAEALPLVVMEASSTGMPVIATDVGSVREEIIDNVTGKVVPPANSNAIVDAIMEILRNPGNWEKMGKSGREHIHNRYDINILSMKLEKIYRRLSC